MGTTNNQRIEYIDVLRGLCMVLIVWYHTNHPELLDYPFYNSTLFFVSGMLFNPLNINLFLKKKFWKLLIPFAFFYVVYYIFLLVINFAKYHTVSYEISTSIFDVFRWYKDNDAYVCNYPLWFLWALFWLQLATNIVTRYIKNHAYLFGGALVISVLGYLYIQHIPTPFIIGRSFTFFVYYIAGYIFLTLIESRFSDKLITTISLIIWVGSFLLRTYLKIHFISTIFYCLEFVSIAIVLLQVCKYMPMKPLRKGLAYIGINSLIVFGMHDMYLSIVRIITTNVCGEMNVWLGCVNWILTLILMVPTIFILNRHFPILVGKNVKL